MPHYRCCVGGCDNDSRYPEKIVKRGHVEGELRWHHILKDPKKREEWTEQISKGLKNFVASDNRVVCSNHFQYGKPKFASSKPTLYLVQSDKIKSSPRKQRFINKEADEAGPCEVKLSKVEEAGVQCFMISSLAYSSLTFAILSRNHDVSMFTGVPSTSAFECVFSFLQKKASLMHYWKGSKDAEKDTSNPCVNSQQRALTRTGIFALHDETETGTFSI